MVFRNNFIAVIKVNNAILREHDGVVQLPFGTEYELTFKNQESRKAKVKISIDGQDVLNGHNLLIGPNSEAKLEGFLGNDGNVTNRFKFIQKTEPIVAHRGDRIDDGIVRIEYWFEAPQPVRIPVKYELTYTYWPPYYPPNVVWRDNNVRSIMPEVYGNHTFCYSQGNSLGTCSNFSVPTPEPDEGITVHGSISDQKLYTGHIGTLEKTSSVIVLRLRGETTQGDQVVQPVTVKCKLKCPTCGHPNKSNNRYCGTCGTCLI